MIGPCIDESVVRYKLSLDVTIATRKLHQINPSSIINCNTLPCGHWTVVRLLTFYTAVVDSLLPIQELCRSFLIKIYEVSDL